MPPSDLFAGTPAFGRRGYMLDVARDRVPTRDTLAWLVDVLAALRFNELQLYVEHTFAYTGHDEVWRNASPLTHDDMAWLARYGAERGVDLVANMNGFGHMGRWLAHDTYRPLAECPDGFESVFGGGHSEPTCLEPTPANAELAVALAREMLSAVGGNRIHIGGDEPFELGEGRSAALVAERGRDRVYLEHLDRIIGPLVGDGIDVLFWADLFRRDPSLMADIPTGATGVVWNYEAPSTGGWIDFLGPDLLERLGMPDDANLGFEAHARLFVDSGTPFWVAPGTGAWNTLIGRNRNAAGNVVDAALVGARRGAPGYLLTDWGDNGHHQPLAVSLPSMVRAAVAAWSGGTGEVAVGPVIDELLSAEPGTGERIDRLGEVGESLGRVAPNGSPVFTELVDTGLPSFGDVDEPALADARVLVDEAIEAFAAQPFGGERGEVMSREMVAICRLARVGLGRMAGEQPSPTELQEAISAHREAWLAGSRPGGLDDSLAKIRR